VPEEEEEVSLRAAFIYKVPRMRLEFVFTLAVRLIYHVISAA